MTQAYLIALGSNQRHPRFGQPDRVLCSALGWIERNGGEVLAQSSIMQSRPLGPSQRDYANAAAIIRSALDPLSMLAMLQGVERAHGRQRAGQRWRARTLDLDIVLWSGGMCADPVLQIPHPRFRERRFVLHPAKEIAPHWRDPVSGLTIAQLHARLTRPRALTR